MTNTNERHKVGDRVSIVKRGQKGNYQAEFHLDGQHCRKSLKTTSKRIALDRESKLNTQLLTGEFESSPQESTLVDAIEQYLNFHRIEDKARKTIVKYRGQLSEFQRFCQKHRIVRLSQIRPSTLDAYRQFRKPSLKPRSMYHEGVTIKQWLKWCVSRQLIKENPLAACRIEKPKLRPPNPSPTLEEVWRIIHACREPLQFHVATLAFTGLRSGEMRQLLADDVDLDGGWVHVVSREEHRTKTGESRDIPIHPELVPFLRRGKSSSGPWYFTAEASNRYPSGGHWINTKKLNDRLQVALRRAKLPTGRDDGFVIHSLRHFFETHCVNTGVPQRVVDIWMGHKGDRSTARYYYDLKPTESVNFMQGINFSQPTTLLTK